MAEFGSLWKEIDILGQLVKAATRATSTAGHTMPVPPKLSTIGDVGPKMVSLFPSDESMFFQLPYSLVGCLFSLSFLSRACKKTSNLKSKYMDWLKNVKPHNNVCDLYVFAMT